jgi:hypothetical protein
MHMMKRGVMTAMAVLGLAAAATSAEAQIGGRQVEVRLDFVNLELDPVRLGAGLPGSAAVGVYLSDKLAVEGRVGLAFVDAEPESSWGLNVGAFLPFYLAGDAGRTGLFVAPGLEIAKIKDVDAAINYGLDFGLKLKKSELISYRVAATLRDGDSYGDMAIGANFGIGIFFK